MQLIFQGLPAAALIPLPAHNRLAEFLQRGEIHHLTLFFVVILVGAQVTGILSLWAASKAVARGEASTLFNAVKVWLFNWVLFIAIVASLFIIVPSVAKSETQARVLLVIGGLGLLSLMLILLIPMKVYVIGLLRSLGLLLLAGLINSGAVFVVELILISTMGLQKDIAELQTAIGKTPAEQRAFGERLTGQEAPDEIDRMLDDALHPIGPRPPLAQREGMVRTLQQKLAARQQALPRGDAAAQTAYNNELARYMEFRKEVIAERNGQPAAAQR
jgi:hypothetical protein